MPIADPTVLPHSRLGLPIKLLISDCCQMILRYWALSVLGSRLDLSESRDVIGHVTIRLTVGHFLLVVLWIQAPTTSEIFNGECDAVIDMTLNDL